MKGYERGKDEKNKKKEGGIGVVRGGLAGEGAVKGRAAFWLLHFPVKCDVNSVPVPWL